MLINQHLIGMINPINSAHTFWVSNISKMNVSLTDLGLTIPAGKTVNLLDKKHYSYTREELLVSAATGSLFKKKSKVVVRKVPPQYNPGIPGVIKEVAAPGNFPSRRRSIVEVIEKEYEELDLSDDTFAQEAADLVDETNK